MAKITKNELSKAKKRAEQTAEALGHDFDQKLHKFYTEYSDSNYETVLEKAIAAKNRHSQNR